MKKIEVKEGDNFIIDDRFIVICLLDISQFIEKSTIENAKILEHSWNQLSKNYQEEVADLLVTAFCILTKQNIEIFPDLKSINDFISLIDETKKENFCSLIKEEAEAIRILNHCLE